MHLITLCAALLPCLQPSDVRSTTTQEADLRGRIEKRLEEQRGRIVDEIAKMTPEEQLRAPWAGEYYCGDGLGMNVLISIAPKNGFVYSWHGCAGLYDSASGAIESADGNCIRLISHRTYYPLKELWFVRWGDRRFLIPRQKLPEFCNAVVDGSAIISHFMRTWAPLRIGDECKLFYGAPDLPKFARETMSGEVLLVEILEVVSFATMPDPDAVGMVRVDSLVRVDPSTVVSLTIGRPLIDPSEAKLFMSSLGQYEITSLDTVSWRVGLRQSCSQDQLRAPRVGLKLVTDRLVIRDRAAERSSRPASRPTER
ncbi:MAG: hypothetical protein JNJ88_11845 [Planctomycetes bacterium]|nr:hypothetical protein [Planctomycetota bacterium]